MLVSSRELQRNYTKLESSKEDCIKQLHEHKSEKPAELLQDEAQKEKSEKRFHLSSSNTESSVISEQRVIAQSSLLPSNEEMPVLKEICRSEECVHKCTEQSSTSVLTNTNIPPKLANLDAAPKYISEMEMQNLYASVKEEMLSLPSLTPELISHTLRWPRADITRAIDDDDDDNDINNKNKTEECSEVNSKETEQKIITCNYSRCEIANSSGNVEAHVMELGTRIAAEVCKLTQSEDNQNNEILDDASYAKRHECEKSKHKKNQKKKKKERSGSRAKKMEKTPCLDSMDVTKSVEEMHNTNDQVVVLESENNNNNMMHIDHLNSIEDHKQCEPNSGNVQLLNSTRVNEETQQTPNVEKDKINNEHQVEYIFCKLHTPTITPLESSIDLVTHSPKLLKEHVLQVEQWYEENLTPRRKHKGKKRKAREHENEALQRHQVSEIKKSQEVREENTLQSSENVQRMCSDVLRESDSTNLLHLTNYTNTSQSEVAQSNDLFVLEANIIQNQSKNYNSVNAVEQSKVREDEISDQADKVSLVTPLQESQLVVVCNELPHNSTSRVSSKEEHQEKVEAERQEVIWAAIEDRDKVSGDIVSGHDSNNAWLQIYKAETPKVEAKNKAKSSSRYASSTEKSKENVAGVTNVAVHYLDSKANEIDKKCCISELDLSHNSKGHHKRKKRRHSSNNNNNINKKIIIIKEPTAAKRRLKRRRRRISESNASPENKPIARYYQHHNHHQGEDNDVIQRVGYKDYKSEQQQQCYQHHQHHHRHRHRHRHKKEKDDDNINYNHHDGNLENEKHSFKLELLQHGSQEYPKCEEEQEAMENMTELAEIEHNTSERMLQYKRGSSNYDNVRPSPPSHARDVEGRTHSPCRHRFYLQEEEENNAQYMNNNNCQCDSFVKSENINCNDNEVEMQEVTKNKKEDQQIEETDKMCLDDLPSKLLQQKEEYEENNKLEYDWNDCDVNAIHVNDVTEKLQHDTEIECMHLAKSKPETELELHKEEQEEEELQEEKSSISFESFVDSIDETKLPTERLNQINTEHDENTINTLNAKSFSEQYSQIQEIEHNADSASLPHVPDNSVFSTTTATIGATATGEKDNDNGNVGIVNVTKNENNKAKYANYNDNININCTNRIIDKLTSGECKGNAIDNSDDANMERQHEKLKLDLCTEKQVNTNATTVAVVEIDNTITAPLTIKQKEGNDEHEELVKEETLPHRISPTSESARILGQEQQIQEEEQQVKLNKLSLEQFRQNEKELSHQLLDHIHHSLSSSSSSSSSESSCEPLHVSASPSVTPHSLPKPLIQSASSCSSQSSFFTEYSRSSSFLSSATPSSSLSSSYSSYSSSSSSVHSIIPQRLPCKDGCETGPPPRVFEDVVFRQQHVNTLKQFAETALIYE